MLPVSLCRTDLVADLPDFLLIGFRFWF